MKVLRIEHSNVMRNGRPAGPYGEEAMAEAEHEDEEFYYGPWDCENESCIHRFVNQISWVCGERRPHPESDGLSLSWDAWADFLFAFQSYEQMHNWFSGWLRKLDRFGFVAAVYDVEDSHVRHGFCQTIFNWDYATRIGDASILSKKQILALLG